jgi:hypothetical protein
MQSVLISRQQQARYQQLMIAKLKRHRESNRMTNELLQKFIGMSCKISTGSYGTTVKGRIVEVQDNWVEVETTHGRELLNADFIQTIKTLYGQ